MLSTLLVLYFILFPNWETYNFQASIYDWHQCQLIARCLEH